MKIVALFSTLFILQCFGFETDFDDKTQKVEKVKPKKQEKDKTTNLDIVKNPNTFKKSLASLFVTQCPFFRSGKNIKPEMEVSILVREVFGCLDKIDNYCTKYPKDFHCHVLDKYEGLDESITSRTQRIQAGLHNAITHIQANHIEVKHIQAEHARKVSHIEKDHQVKQHIKTPEHKKTQHQQKEHIKSEHIVVKHYGFQ